jgi:hypothetical protein
MYGQLTLWDTGSVTSSPASASGATPCAQQAGPTISRYGPDPARASLSPRQAKAQGLLTSGTSGPLSSTSLSSASLQSCLESRLQATTRALGSTLYTLTWKRWATPSGVCRSRLQASARRTSETGRTGWVTPTARTERAEVELVDETATTLVNSGGVLVAILPAGARGKDWLGAGWACEWSSPYENEFAGTSVAVVILKATRGEKA